MLDTAANRRSFTLASAPGLTGDFVVAAAVPGWKRPSAVDDGKSFRLLALNGTSWEQRKRCVYTHASNTVTRGVLEESSDPAGASINLGPFTVATVVMSAEQANRVLVPGPQDFGAACDLVPLMNATIASGSNVFNSSDAKFTAADIGKTIAITGAGVAIGTSVTPDAVTLYGPLVTTITGVNSPTQVTLAATASRSIVPGMGIQYVSQDATVEGGAKAFYGTDDTAALQAYVDYAHPADGIVRIPNPGCLILGTIYCQRSRDTSGAGLLWRRLEFRGVGPTAQSGLTGIANSADSNLFKPTAGPILAVNLDATGAGMTSTGATPTHQFYNFNVNGIAFAGMPGVATQAMKLHRVRVKLKDVTFNNLQLGWDGLSADVNGSPNYCDQWTTKNVRFNNCAGMFKQAEVDACEWTQLLAESHYPSITVAIELLGGRGWEIKVPLINNLPESATLGLFTYSKAGTVKAGHFEHIWGRAFDIVGSNSNGWVDIIGCDFYVPLSSTRPLTADTIKYTSAGGTVERCGFSFNRASGLDINFASGRHQTHRNNSYYEADNTTWRRSYVDLQVGPGWNSGNPNSMGTSFNQPWFLEIVWDGTIFDIRNVNGSSIRPAILSGPPTLSGAGNLNLDGARLWSRPVMAIPVQKEGKYLPKLVGIYILQIAFFDASGTKVTTPDADMNCYLLVS